METVSDELTQIALQVARKGAADWANHARYESDPHPFQYVVSVIAEDIGMAFFNAHYAFNINTLPRWRREEIAAQALQEAGYPESS